MTRSAMERAAITFVTQLAGHDHALVIWAAIAGLLMLGAWARSAARAWHLGQRQHVRAADQSGGTDPIAACRCWASSTCALNWLRSHANHGAEQKGIEDSAHLLRNVTARMWHRSMLAG